MDMRLRHIGRRVDELVQNLRHRKRFTEHVCSWSQARPRVEAKTLELSGEPYDLERVRLIPERATSNIEQAVCLAAIHDECCPGADPIDPWAAAYEPPVEHEQTDEQIPTQSAIRYAVARNRVKDLTNADLDRVERWYEQMFSQTTGSTVTYTGVIESDAVGQHANSVADVQKVLLAMYARGESYAPQRDLAHRFGCSTATINKAIKSSRSLTGWKMRAQPERGRHPEKGAKRVPFESIHQTREPDPMAYTEAKEEREYADTLHI